MLNTHVQCPLLLPFHNRAAVVLKTIMWSVVYGGSCVERPAQLAGSELIAEAYLLPTQ